MAHHHDKNYVLLKTDNGYLGKNGFIQDLTSEEIIIISISYLGGHWTTEKNLIQSFLKLSKISYINFKQLTNLDTKIKLFNYDEKNEVCLTCKNSKECFKCKNKDKIKLYNFFGI